MRLARGTREIIKAGGLADMSSMSQVAPNLAPRTIQPLAANIKLKAINSMRVNFKLPPANSAPPAQITLTPAVPTMGGANYIRVFGEYMTKPGYAAILLDSSRRGWVQICFQAAQGKTYLADVAVADGTQNWQYTCEQTGKPSSGGQVTAQQGHLLIPFIAASSYITLMLSPMGGGQFVSAEMTRVD